MGGNEPEREVGTFMISASCLGKQAAPAEGTQRLELQRGLQSGG